MNLFDAYGIKEVADVTFYDTATGAPVLYLDTLKVSTIEETAEQSTANGGKGNAPLIVWDYGKNITLTLEDALFSMKSMAVLFGGRISKTKSVKRAKRFVATDELQVPAGIPAEAIIYDQLGREVHAYEPGLDYIATWDQLADTEIITINAESFPGTYKVVGDTYARNRDTGKDEFFQFIIPMAKMNSENTITMQAEGDPSTFSMTLQVLRPEDGDMMKLVKYPNTEGKTYTDENLIIDLGDGQNFVPGDQNLNPGIASIPEPTYSFPGLDGKKPADLISDDTFVRSDGSVVGTLKHVEGWTQFSSNPEQQKGNFFPIHLTQTGSKMTVTKNGKVVHNDVTFDPDIVARIDNNAVKINIAVDGKSVLDLNFVEATLANG